MQPSGRWLWIGVTSAYVVIGLLMVTGSAPIWCLGTVLTLPQGLRICLNGPAVGPDRQLYAVRSWFLAFAFQVAIGYTVVGIIR